MKTVIEIVGEEVKSFEHDNGLIFLYRDPTSKELINYKNHIRYRKRGKTFTTESAGQQLVLADKILIDVEGLGYKSPDGEIKVLNKATKPAEIAHLKVEGETPASWKDLIPAVRKIHFIENIIAGIEEEEKN